VSNDEIYSLASLLNFDGDCFYDFVVRMPWDTTFGCASLLPLKPLRNICLLIACFAYEFSCSALVDARRSWLR